jgi:hypothetical protein
LAKITSTSICLLLQYMICICWHIHNILICSPSTFRILHMLWNINYMIYEGTYMDINLLYINYMDTWILIPYTLHGYMDTWIHGYSYIIHYMDTWILLSYTLHVILKVLLLWHLLNMLILMQNE